MKTVYALILTLAMASAATADNATFEQLLSGKEYPLTLKLKDLDGNWRRCSTGSGTEGMNSAAIVRAMYGGFGGGSSYYTKGQTVTVGGETYLVAYRMQTKQLDAAALTAAMRGGQPPEPEKPTAVTPIALTLLNLRSTGSLTDIRPFSLEVELGGADTGGGDDDKSLQETNEASLKNLRQLGTAVLTYVGERKVLPSLTDAKAAQEELLLYLRSKDALNQPGTQKPYQPNPALSGRKPSEFDKPEKVVVFYEASVSGDGTRGVLFLDGHAERITDQQWKRVKELSRLP